LIVHCDGQEKHNIIIIIMRAVNVGGTQAYIAVPAELETQIRLHGYICQKRDHVPCHQEMRKAVKGMLNHEKDDKLRESVLLEVFGLPDDMLEVDAEGNGKILTKHLEGKYLRSGLYKVRALAEFAGKPCMFCDDESQMDASKRGKLGLAWFKGDTYMCSPCKNGECLKKMTERSNRMEASQVLELYHATNADIAKEIEGVCQGRFVRGDFFGKAGAAGGGLYFGHTARECNWKAEASPDSEPVTFKCRVRLGNPKLCPFQCDGPKDRMFKHLLTHQDGPFDSVILDRTAKQPGQKGTFPVPERPIHGTRIEDLNIGEKCHPGYEFVVYSWDQVEVLERVPEDAVPAGYKSGLKDGVMVRTS
jgi:hypothetical protein